MTAEVHLLSLFARQTGLGDVIVLDMDYANLDRIIFLIRKIDSNDYYLLICQYSTGSDPLAVQFIKSLKKHEQTSKDD